MITKKPAGRPANEEASVQTAIRWSAVELARIDAYCNKQRFSPTRSDVVRAAVREFLDREEKK